MQQKRKNHYKSEGLERVTQALKPFQISGENYHLHWDSVSESVSDIPDIRDIEAKYYVCTLMHSSKVSKTDAQLKKKHQAHRDHIFTQLELALDNDCKPLIKMYGFFAAEIYYYDIDQLESDASTYKNFDQLLKERFQSEENYLKIRTQLHVSYYASLYRSKRKTPDSLGKIGRMIFYFVSTLPGNDYFAHWDGTTHSITSVPDPFDLEAKYYVCAVMNSSDIDPVDFPLKEKHAQYRVYLFQQLENALEQNCKTLIWRYLELAVNLYLYDLDQLNPHLLTQERMDQLLAAQFKNQEHYFYVRASLPTLYSRRGQYRKRTETASKAEYRTLCTRDYEMSIYYLLTTSNTMHNKTPKPKQLARKLFVGQSFTSPTLITTDQSRQREYLSALRRYWFFMSDDPSFPKTSNQSQKSRSGGSLQPPYPEDDSQDSLHNDPRHQKFVEHVFALEYYHRFYQDDPHREPELEALFTLHEYFLKISFSPMTTHREQRFWRAEHIHYATGAVVKLHSYFLKTLPQLHTPQQKELHIAIASQYEQAYQDCRGKRHQHSKSKLILAAFHYLMAQSSDFYISIQSLFKSFEKTENEKFVPLDNTSSVETHLLVFLYALKRGYPDLYKQAISQSCIQSKLANLQKTDISAVNEDLIKHLEEWSAHINPTANPKDRSVISSRTKWIVSIIIGVVCAVIAIGLSLGTGLSLVGLFASLIKVTLPFSGTIAGLIDGAISLIVGGTLTYSITSFINWLSTPSIVVKEQKHVSDFAPSPHPAMASLHTRSSAHMAEKKRDNQLFDGIIHPIQKEVIFDIQTAQADSEDSDSAQRHPQ